MFEEHKVTNIIEKIWCVCFKNILVWAMENTKETRPFKESRNKTHLNLQRPRQHVQGPHGFGPGEFPALREVDTNQNPLPRTYL